MHISKMLCVYKLKPLLLLDVAMQFVIQQELIYKHSRAVACSNVKIKRLYRKRSVLRNEMKSVSGEPN